MFLQKAIIFISQSLDEDEGKDVDTSGDLHLQGVIDRLVVADIKTLVKCFKHMADLYAHPLGSESSSDEIISSILAKSERSVN
jgi:hypothetical protein